MRVDAVVGQEQAAMHPIKLVLIGGTSHAGKSTPARRLAGDLGWDCLSTDQLARHPGRPWRADQPVPEDVVAHYRELSDSELVDSVLSSQEIVGPSTFRC